jgi:hypothetical protein
VPAPRRNESPRVEGSVGEVAFTIDLVKVSGRLKTRVRAAVTKGPGAKVAIIQRGGLGRAMGTRAEGESPTGIASFDHAYRVHGMEADEARAWLETSMKDLVCLDERSDVWLGSDGATVTLTWSNVEMNPVLLDAARDVVVSLALWHRPEFPYR